MANKMFKKLQRKRSMNKLTIWNRQTKTIIERKMHTKKEKTENEKYSQTDDESNNDKIFIYMVSRFSELFIYVIVGERKKTRKIL